MTQARRLPLLTLSIAAAFLGAACGGSSSSVKAATEDELTAVAPTSASVDLEVGDATGMADNVPTSSISADANVLAPGMDVCHPHLFARTAEVAWRLNAVFFRHLRHIERLIAKHPKLLAGDSATWSETGSGFEVQRQFVITRSSDGLTYDFELDLAPAAQAPPVWVKVFSGSTTNATTSTGSDQTGSLDFDYDALHSVIPDDRLTGQIAIAFERITDSSKPAPGKKKVTTVTFHGFSFGPNDPHGPRSGTFTHVGEPGVGGSLTFQDSLVLLCPANPTAQVADAVTHARWYVTNGALHGRADAKATGGQIPSGDTWLGVTCYQGTHGVRPLATAENGYWAMKLEDGSGATVTGSARHAGSEQSCDSAFGAVPSLTDNQTDYDFTAAVTFPNEW